ncbi:MAG: ABC transporter substrate-binding protein, partial [Thermoplasmata archaeon]|nr:ABC transporter substrate-binding protein [Thermoplasmata archaeon]
MGRFSAGVVGSVLFLTMFAAAALTVPMEVSSAEGDVVLTIGHMQAVDSLNPFIGMTDSSLFLYGLLYDGLMSIDENLEPVPNLATDWRMVPESDPEMTATGEPYGSVWEYNLTTNANWTDGEPFTSADVVFTVNLNALNYDTIWAYQPYSYFINYSEAVDEDTVRIHFWDRDTGVAVPCAYGDSMLMPILPAHILGGAVPSYLGFSWDGTIEIYDPPIIGTGPFMATASIADDWATTGILTLVKNPYYHGLADYAKEIQFDMLVMQLFNDETALRIALEQGSVDVAQLPVEEYTDLRSGIISGDIDDIDYYDGPKCNQYWTDIGINMNSAGPNPARLDPAVRQAMALSTNKTHIVEDMYFGQATEGTTLIAPTNDYWHYEPSFNELYRYNLDNASNLLEVAGYEYTVASPYVRVATAGSWAVQEGLVTEGTLLEFEMLVRQEHPEEYDIAKYLEYTWAQVGMDLNLVVLSEVTLSTYVYSYYYDTAIWYWSSDPDPNYMLFCESSFAINGWNDNYYISESYDENYSASVSALDPAERKGYVDACQLTNYRDVPYIILAYPNQTYAWRTDTFTGWGDWSLPGRTLDNCWGANPVLFDLAEAVVVPDASPPTTECELTGTMGSDGWYVSQVTVDLSAADDEGTVAWTNYSLDGAAWATYSDEFAVSEAGDHTLEYYSVDDSGNEEPVQESSFKIDTTPPGEADAQVDGTLGADPDWFVSDVTVTLTAPVDETSGVLVTMYKIDSVAWATYVGAFPLDNDGKHNVSFYCEDSAGNVGATDTVAIWIDTEDPTVVVTSPVAAESLSSGDVTVEF